MEGVGEGRCVSSRASRVHVAAARDAGEWKWASRRRCASSQAEPTSADADADGGKGCSICGCEAE